MPLWRFSQTGLRRLRRVLSAWLDIGLNTKMTAIAIIGVIALVGLFAYLGTAALNENTQRTLQERVFLAQITARHIDYILAAIQDTLTDTAQQPGWRDTARAEENLRAAFEQLNFFAPRVFLLDQTGNLIAAYPPFHSPVAFTQYAVVQAVLDNQPFAVSRYLRTLDLTTSSTLAAVPLRDETGQVFGALVTAVDLSGANIQIFSDPVGLGNTGYMDLIDLGGTILASTHLDRVGKQSDHNATLTLLIETKHQTVSACHDCHNATTTTVPIREVLAFAPLERAQWGVAVRQSEAEVFASIYQLQTRIFILMGIMLLGALLLVYLTTRSVIVPVQALTAATQRITAGDLNTPLTVHGRDEIGTLAHSLDVMRARLQTSMAEIQTWNRELDTRVNERTAAVEKARAEILQLYQELQHKEQIRRELLNRVFTTQEEERKRISRELHDETCQVLTGLAYALDDIAEITDSPALKPQLERMHALANTAVEEIQRIILDLRPTMLDHLGLIPALRWYAEARLGEMNIQFSLRETGTPRRLAPPIETALFRVAQEAINNIVRHSNAIRAELVFQFLPTVLRVTIADDGQGFDFDQVFDATNGARGMGLLGMRERMDAIGGELVLRSVPGRGTIVEVSVPLDEPDLEGLAQGNRNEQADSRVAR